MKRTIGMATDHDYYGYPVEYSYITLTYDADLTDDQIKVLERNQEMRLRSMAKAMPHRYWMEGK